MSDLLIISGCTLAGAIVGGGISWAVCSIIAGAKIFAMRQDLEAARERASLGWSLYAKAIELSESALNAIPPKRPRENGTVAKLRRILEGGE